MKKTIFFFLLFLTAILHSQPVEVSGFTSGNAILSSEESIPFWMHTNSNTALGSESNYGFQAGLLVRYSKDNILLEGGLSGFYREDVPNEFQRNDLYLRFANSWMQITLGARHQEIVANGLSATNKNFLWSSNARPLPGLIVEAYEPLRLNTTFAIDWGIAHYRLNDERFVRDVNVHYKRLALLTTLNENNRLVARLQHYAQWGGNSPVLGELPNDFNAFYDVFLAKKRTLVTEEIIYQNALGNHLGSLFLEYGTSNTLGTFEFYHEHPFEDGSGTRFANFPDGVWGIHFRPVSNKIISSFLYEYIDTSDQSGPGAGSGMDAYFSNNLYRSGWSYEKNVIGFPFILFDPTIVLNELNSPYVSNRVQLHHFGFAGTFKKIDWRLKSTVSRQLGTYRHPIVPAVNSWFNFVSFQYNTEDYGIFSLVGGADFSDSSDTVAGAGIGYLYSF